MRTGTDISREAIESAIRRLCLTRRVRAWAGWDEARRAAWPAPGVKLAGNTISVGA